MKILIIEDEVLLADSLKELMIQKGYEADTAYDGITGEEYAELGIYDLIILDVMLPGMDGFAVCSKIRETSNAHILIVSAKTEKNDKLKGLNLGADDYIEKPYDMDILLAKIHGIFKRKYAQEELISGTIRLNTATQTIYVADQKVDSTAKEFELLKLLMENKGVTLKKEYLFRTIWGSDSESEMQTLTVHIKWLRQKIEKDPKHPDHIITEWGTGYRFE